MESRQVYIYSLEYPKGNVRYIGKSTNPQKRYNSHIEDAVKSTNSKKLAWIRSLLNIGVKPYLNIVDTVLEIEWEYWERYYIQGCLEMGYDLTNSTLGGDGLSNPSVEIRNKISESLKAFYSTHKVWNYRLSGVSIGYPKGKTRSIEDAFANSKRKIEQATKRKPWNYGKKLSKEQCAKISFDRLVKPLKSIKIVQFDLNMNKLEEFDSMRDAILKFGLSRKNLKKCLDGRFPNDGTYIWKYNTM